LLQIESNTGIFRAGSADLGVCEPDLPPPQSQRGSDRLLVRRLPVLVQAAGFENLSLLQSYGLIESF
jgi:hypothetical protein